MHGDCNVPKRWAEDLTLGEWVNRQRQYKKKLGRGEPSNGMTAARVAKLDTLGFAWELSAANDAGWDAQLAKLRAYKAMHGDCNVPRSWAEDLTLGEWVKGQRYRKKKLDRGEPGKGMTAARAAKLEALGFVWELSTAAPNNPHRTQADAQEAEEEEDEEEDEDEDEEEDEEEDEGEGEGEDEEEEEDDEKLQEGGPAEPDSPVHPRKKAKTAEDSPHTAAPDSPARRLSGATRCDRPETLRIGLLRRGPRCHSALSFPVPTATVRV
jgi:cobalamin biosynthesis protein CobT